MLYKRFGKPAVDAAMAEVEGGDEANEKSINFSTYVNIQTKAGKICRSADSSLGVKPGAAMVPQVKGANLISQDPALSHLL